MGKELKYKEVGRIGNYYGGLCISEHEGKYYWLIENYDTEFDKIEGNNWKEITKEGYEMLKKGIEVK